MHFANLQSDTYTDASMRCAQNVVPFQVPKIVCRPHTKSRQRGPNLESHPFTEPESRHLVGSCFLLRRFYACGVGDMNTMRRILGAMLQYDWDAELGLLT